MWNEIKPCWVVFIMLAILSMRNFVVGTPTVPCYFIFGDSLVDNGNNNKLQTSAKVDHWPYGIDFRSGPTGRFTNGQTIVDIMAKQLGFEDYIQPFATAQGLEILKGINYASGSAGIRDETGKNLGVCISLNKQLANHKTTVSRIAGLLGTRKTAKKLLHKCLYSFNIGNNDYINNYFMPQFYNTSKLYSPEEYAKVLIKQFSDQIRTLYKQGARKMYMSGVGTIGCTPNAISSYRTNGALCVNKMNSAATRFNKLLRSLVERLNMEFTDAKFVYIDTLKMTLDYTSTLPTTSNMNVSGCCKVGENGLCIAGEPPCQQRETAPFWDSFHPTEAVNKVLANKLLTSLDQSELYPMNVQQLARLTIRNTKLN